MILTILCWLWVGILLCVQPSTCYLILNVDDTHNIMLTVGRYTLVCSAIYLHLILNVDDTHNIMLTVGRHCQTCYWKGLHLCIKRTHVSQTFKFCLLVCFRSENFTTEFSYYLTCLRLKALSHPEEQQNCTIHRIIELIEKDPYNYGVINTNVTEIGACLGGMYIFTTCIIWASSQENLPGSLQPGKTQTGLLYFRSQLKSWNFRYSKYRYYTISAANNKSAD